MKEIEKILNQTIRGISDLVSQQVVFGAFARYKKTTAILFGLAGCGIQTLWINLPLYFDKLNGFVTAYPVYALSIVVTVLIFVTGSIK